MCLLTHSLPKPSILLNITRICHSQFQCNYVSKENLFIYFLFHFCNLHQISNILKKKRMLIANVFPKLQTVKNVVRPLCKKRHFGTRFHTHHDKVSQILAKSPSENFYHLSSSFSAKLIWKMSPLVLGEIFGVFVDTFPADGKYPVEHYENLQLPIQM